ncbi:MAG TPA: hypothetical protein DCM54_16125, partial [Gammaproteobacteria bacterium]|nr:hypothetical protein [Gammaproteobacteria bacterium]
SSDEFVIHLKSLFSFEGKKLFDLEYIETKSDAQLSSLLVSELNLIVEGDSLYDETLLKNLELSMHAKGLLAREDLNPLKLNRRILEDALWTFLGSKQEIVRHRDDQDLTVLDVILEDDIREDFILECRNLIIFSIVYNNLIGDLVSVARQAHESRTLPDSFIEKLLDESVVEAQVSEIFSGLSAPQIQDDFADWMEQLAGHSRSATFLKSVEEWMRIVHKDKSDTLFVVVSFFFEKILPEYYSSR